MTAPVGGQRDRLISESFAEMIEGALDALGWMDVVLPDGVPGIEVRTAPVGPDEEVPLNTVAVTSEPVDDEEMELGSTATIDTHEGWVEMYAYKDSFGKAVIGDVRDILRGKMPSIGRTGPVLDVYDYRQATPTVIFSCTIENVRTDTATGPRRGFERNLRACRCDIVEERD